jgi:hypothetical protein
MDMLKNNKNKHKYVSIKLSDFNKIMKIIIENNSQNIILTKYLLKLHKDENIRNVYQSKLVGIEISHLINVIKTRYMRKIREIEILLKKDNM